MALRRMSADRDGTRLRWVADGGLSLRAYELGRSAGAAPCVSTRSSELTFVLAGRLEVAVGRDRRVVACPGEGLLVLRGTPHTTVTEPGTRFVILDLPAVDHSELGVVPLPAPAIPLAVERRFVDFWEQRNPIDLGRPLDGMLKEPVARHLVPLGGTHTTARMLAVKRYLDRSYRDKLEVADVARRFGMNRYYLAREFRRNFGASPLEYVQCLRLEHFVWSLLHGPKPGQMLALAADAGFGDYATFCRRVRQSLGRSPSALVDEAP